MDPRVLSNLRAVHHAPVEELAEFFTNAFFETDSELWTVREGQPEAVVGAARDGAPELIGIAKEPLVMLFIYDLATLLAAAGDQTMADVLSRPGAKPYVGGCILVGKGHRRERLKRCGATVSDAEV